MPRVKFLVSLNLDAAGVSPVAAEAFRGDILPKVAHIVVAGLVGMGIADRLLDM